MYLSEMSPSATGGNNYTSSHYILLLNKRASVEVSVLEFLSLLKNISCSLVVMVLLRFVVVPLIHVKLPHIEFPSCVGIKFFTTSFKS